MTFEIRPLNSEVEITSKLLGEIYELEQISHELPWKASQIQEEFNRQNALNLIALSENKVVAYLFSYVFLEDLHILNLVVGEECRKKGIASELLRSSTSSAKNLGVSTVLLECRESNNSAISLYLKHGFVQCGRRSSYYPREGGREGALLFIKEI